MNFSTNGGNLSSDVGTTAGATLMDTVAFANLTPGAMATLTLDVGLSMTTNGLLEGTDDLAVSGGTVNMQASETVVKNIAGNVTYTDANGNFLSGWFPLTVNFPIAAGVPYQVTSGVGSQVFEPNLFSANFPPAGIVFGVISIDPTWSLDVPAGVTYTSASGFPIGGSITAAAAPEPAPIFMFVIGLAAFGWIRAIRSRKS